MAAKTGDDDPVGSLRLLALLAGLKGLRHVSPLLFLGHVLHGLLRIHELYQVIRQ